jgi:hypothetical protein
MIVGQTIVLSADHAELVPAEARIASGVPNDTRDFSDENATALARRGETLARYEADKKARKEGGKPASKRYLTRLARRASKLWSWLSSLEREGCTI